MSEVSSFLTRWTKVIEQTTGAARDEYNDGYTHEALHTAHVLSNTWDLFVTNTRCADEYPDVKKAAEDAAYAMDQVYQLIGQKFRDE